MSCSGKDKGPVRSEIVKLQGTESYTTQFRILSPCIVKPPMTLRQFLAVFIQWV